MVLHQSYKLHVNEGGTGLRVVRDRWIRNIAKEKLLDDLREKLKRIACSHLTCDEKSFLSQPRA